MLPFFQHVMQFNQARLLILFGASLDEITFPKAISSKIKESLFETQNFYRKTIAPLENQATVAAYQRLAEAWHRISEQESNPVLKECYQIKADNYYEKAQAKEAGAVSDIGLTVTKFKQL